MIYLKLYLLLSLTIWSFVLSFTNIVDEHTTLSEELSTEVENQLEYEVLSLPKATNIPDNEIFDMLLAKRKNMSGEVTGNSAETKKFSDGSFGRYLIWLALLAYYKIVHFLLPRLIWRFKKN